MVFLVFSRKRWFFWFETIFFSRKRWFLSSRSSKNHLFLEKKMVFRDYPGKTIFFSRKRWFSGGLVLVKPSFSREKDGFWRSFPGKTIFFSRKRWFFEGWLFKTIIFSRKRWFRTKNHLFLEKTKKTKKTKKTIFSKTLGLGPSKDGFFGFLEKKMVFLVSNQKNHLFLEKTKKTIFWRHQPHSFGKDGFFGFFGFFGFLDFFGLLVFVSFLFCCFLP